MLIFPSDWEAGLLPHHFLWVLDCYCSLLHRAVVLGWNPSNFLNPVCGFSIGSAAVLNKNVQPKYCLAEQYFLSLWGYFLSLQEVISFLSKPQHLFVPERICTKALLMIMLLRCTMSPQFLKESILHANEERSLHLYSSEELVVN